MKSLTTVFLLFFSMNLMAMNNPQIRICHQKNGEFLSVDLGNDQVGLCKIGNSYVGALDLVYLAQNQTSESLISYAQREKNCQGNEVQVVISDDANLKTNFKTLCQLSDGSLIDIDTLNSGRDSVENSALNMALGL